MTDDAMVLESQAAQMKANVQLLRDQVKAEYAQAREISTLEGYRDALIRVRTLQDSLEEYVAFAISTRGAMLRAAGEAKKVYDEAWAREVDQGRSDPVRRGPEMEGPRERYARFDLRVFQQFRAHRQAEQRVLLVTELLDEIQLRYRAVNATREDLHDIMRSYAFERALER